MKLRKILFLLVAMVLAFAVVGCKKEEQSKVQEIDDADIVEIEDYTSVYDVIGSKITIADVVEAADGSATITKDGKTYTLGLDFLSMAMVYNCTPAGSYTTEEEVYNQWWKLYIQRWNKMMPEVPLYSNQYYDVFAGKIDQFKTSPYWSAGDAIVGATSTDGKVIIGSSTELSGLFRAPSFGKTSPGASDLVISKLTTGYDTVASGFGGSYFDNTDVVESIVKTSNEDGSETFTITIKQGLKDSKNREITADYYIAGTIVANTPIYGAAGGNSTGSISVVGYDSFLAYDGTNAAEEGVTTTFEGIKKLGDYEFSVQIAPDYCGYYYSNTYAAFSPADPEIYLNGATITVDPTTKAVGLSEDFYETTTKDGVKAYVNAAKLKANINNNDPEAFAYTGPYVVKSYDSTSKVATLEKNPYYVTESYRKYEAEDGSLKDGNINQISYVQVITATQTDQLKKGEVNVLEGITGGSDTDAAIDLCKDGAFKYTYYDRAGYGKLAFKCDYGPTQFAEVRQAITYTINRDQFASTFTGGYGTVVDGPYYMGSSAYNAVKRTIKLESYDYSVDDAKAVLEAGGWVYSFDGKKITDYTGTGVRYKKLTGTELSKANIHWAAKDGAYKTVKVDGEYYMPLVINWFGTPADENEVTALLKTSWETSNASKDCGFYITSTEGDFTIVLYGEYYQMEPYGYSHGDTPICSCANFATGFNSAIYDMSYTWSISPDFYMDYNCQMMDPADFASNY